MGSYKLIILKIGVSAADPVDLLRLTRREHITGIEAKVVSQQALPVQDFVNARDAAGESVSGVEESGVEVG